MTSKSSKFTTNQKWTMASSSCGTAMQSMDMMFLAFALSPMIHQLHVSGAAGGFIGSISNIGMLFGAIIFGLLADKFGRVKTFTYTIFLFAFATGALYFANNIYLVYALRFLVGVGSGGEEGTGVTLIAENFKGHRITHLISLAQGFGELGSVLASGVSAAILPMMGWHGLFLFGTLPAILAFIVRIKLKENPHFIKNVQIRKKQRNKQTSFGKLFRTPKFTYLTCAMTTMFLVDAASYEGIMNWMPTIMQKQLHVSITQSSIWMISTVVGVTLGMLTFGKVMDHFGPKVAFTIYFLIAPVSVYSIVLSKTAVTLLIATTIVGFFAEGAYSGYGVIISELYPTEIRATANCFCDACGKAIGSFSLVLIGFLLDYYSLTTVIIYLSALPLINLCILYTLPGLKKVKANLMQN